MEQKKCSKCGVLFDKNTDNFGWVKSDRYRAGGFFTPKCRKCEAKRQRDIRVKNPNKTRRYYRDYQIMREYKPPCLHTNNEKCVKIECRHHMAQFFPNIYNRYTPISTASDHLVNMPYTCIHDVFHDYPDGMTYQEIGDVLGISDRAAYQRVQKAIGRIEVNKKGKELADMLDD